MAPVNNNQNTTNRNQNISNNQSPPIGSQNSINDINSPNHPLYLHPNDHPGLILISKKLIGSENYSSWKRSMMIALNAKIKLKKKNNVVQEMMTSLSKKYERLKEIFGELGINRSLPLSEQVPSIPSSRKRNALELDPEIRIAGLECNRSLLEGIQFVNNKVIETHEHIIVFIDVFGDQAFQRASDIHKVEVESLLGYMVMAGNIRTPKN
nr:cysteine-rich RLK (receptor-like protein kinase) 8 [Tanacetum cinerariifolium]